MPDRTETLAPRASSPTAEESDPPARELTTGADDPERYQQIAEHARGGLGRVVRAVDKRLGRTVAVKELLRHDASNESRFMREAMITARLEHPGIVPVHEAGRWPNGDPYYVMKLVEGRTLKELICERKTLRERLELLPHVIAIADAVGYAHSEGVIHRDLKPSNVIVGEFGETIVVDWGLARDRKRDVPEPTPDDFISAAGSGASTVSGKVVGTPAYMSPEQARGEELVDERADVYAIGAVLYELLAGTPPHHDDTPQATLERVIAGPPMPVQLSAPHVPSELATIVGKAMARCPVDRYVNATALAEDLRRFARGKLVSAHSYTAWSLLRKKVSQHRGVVAVALASTLVLLMGGVESFRRVVAERNIAQQERARAVDSQSQAVNRQRELVLLQAVTSLRKDPTATIAWLKDYRIADEDRARVLDVVDEALAEGVSRHVFRPGSWVWDAAFAGDGRTIVSAVNDGTVRTYDLRTGIETRLGRASSVPVSLAVSPTGQFAITGGMLGEVMMWPMLGGEPRELASDHSKVTSVALSKDGERVLVIRERGAPEIVPLDGGAHTVLAPATSLHAVVADDDWTHQVFTTAPNQVAAPGTEPRVLAKIDKRIWMLALAPRGDLVLIHDGTSVWSVPYAGGPLKLFATFDGRLKNATWSPDQRTVALCGDQSDIVLVDVPTGKTRELRGHTDACYMTEWTRDGHRILSAGDDSTARVWNVADLTSIVLRGHDDDVVSARFSADERAVVTSSLDGSARVWQIEQPGTRVLVEGDPIEGMTLTGDRALVSTANEVAWLNVASGHRVPLFSWAKDRTLGWGAPSPDGARLLVPAADSSLEVRRPTAPSLFLRGHHAPINHVEFSRDSKLLFTSSIDGSLRRWDLDTGKGTLLLDGKLPIRTFAVGARNQVAVQVGVDSWKMIEPGGATRSLGTWCAESAEFDKVRDRLLIRRCDRTFAMSDGHRVTDLPSGNSRVMRVAVSNDGARIAGAMDDRTVRVWDGMTGRVLDVLRGHTDLPLDVAFSPDGTVLASSSYDKTVRLWQPGTRRTRVLRGHTGPVNQIEWTDPAHIVTGSRDGTLRVWDVPSLDLPTAGELAARLERATTARIDIDHPTTNPQPRGT